MGGNVLLCRGTKMQIFPTLTHFFSDFLTPAIRTVSSTMQLNILRFICGSVGSAGGGIEARRLCWPEGKVVVCVMAMSGLARVWRLLVLAKNTLMCIKHARVWGFII